MKKLILINCLLAVISLQAQAQHLDKLSEAERNKILIEEADKVARTYTADYLIAAKAPTARRMHSDIIEIMIEGYQNELERGDEQRIYNAKSGKDVMNGRVFYVVTYPYDEKRDFFPLGSALEILIWADNHKPFELWAGDGPILVNLDEEKPKYDERRVLRHTPKPIPQTSN